MEDEPSIARLIGLGLGFVLGMSPTIIALVRRHPRRRMIILLNVLAFLVPAFLGVRATKDDDLLTAWLMLLIAGGVFWIGSLGLSITRPKPPLADDGSHRKGRAVTHRFPRLSSVTPRAP